MNHLRERIAGFIFNELPAPEMEEARRHIAACEECGRQVQEFERTRSILKMSPDAEPPRHIVFEVERTRRAWRWFVPAGVAAAILIAALIAAPLQIQWHDSQLSIAFGKLPSAVPATAPSAAAPFPAAVQPVDYGRIEKELTSSGRAWLVEELKKRDAAQQKQIERLRDQLVYMEAKQRAIEVRGIENTSSLQYLAERSGDRN